MPFDLGILKKIQNQAKKLNISTEVKQNRKEINESQVQTPTILEQSRGSAARAQFDSVDGMLSVPSLGSYAARAK